MECETYCLVCLPFAESVGSDDFIYKVCRMVECAGRHFCSHFYSSYYFLSHPIEMSSFANSCFYSVHRHLRRLSHLVVGHLFESSKDIVVVTGGSSGLGRELASLFAATGAQVAVVDVNLPLTEASVPSVHYFKCDVGLREEVESCYEQICATMGVPTILINNAGITDGKTILEMSYPDIERIIRINLLLSFFTIKVFLPSMLAQRRGYIVTIGSVLGYMSPAQLSAYGASKSGLVAIHELLTYELGPPLLCVTGVKTLLVCPGKMKTSMFDGVVSPWRWLAPELEPLDVARTILEALEHGRRGEIKLPLYGNFLPVFRAMPWPITELARHVSGIDESMCTYKNAPNKQASAISMPRSY